MEIKRYLLSFFLIFLFCVQGYSQPKFPRVSPGAKVSQVIGITEVSVDYHRPGVKGRLIWDGLVPLGEIWRAGANEATTISFSDPVTIEGANIPAGKYSLFILPEKNTNSAVMVLNKNVELWGTYGYKEEDDVLRVRVKPKYIEHQEWLIYTFEDLQKNSAVLQMHWEDFAAELLITVDTDKLVLESAKDTKGWKDLYQVANYCYENKVNPETGKDWLKRSLKEEKNYWNLSLQALYHAEDGQLDGARAVMEEAIKLGKELENKPRNLEDMEKQLAEWKTK
ncbi:MAG: DUF2911 domain-containing protein [Calditrichales bacterium]|nr:MAG: DUF2911 domain-containing protein [Calditrichales bacterium]